MPVVDASVLVAFLVGGAPARTTEAVYLALAEALDEPLLTFDKRLAGVPGTHATVTVVA